MLDKREERAIGYQQAKGKCIDAEQITTAFHIATGHRQCSFMYYMYAPRSASCCNRKAQKHTRIALQQINLHNFKPAKYRHKDIEMSS